MYYVSAGIPVIGEGQVPPGWPAWSQTRVVPGAGIAVAGEPRRWLTRTVFAHLPRPSELPPRPPIAAGLLPLPSPSTLPPPPPIYMAPPRTLPTLTQYQAWRDQR